MTPEMRMGKPFRVGAETYAHTFGPIRPVAFLSYEHMFPFARTSTLAQRALDALCLTRSFLLLEDDHDVDWEVGQDEHFQAIHPHRAPLRGRRAARRPGQPAAVGHVCLCPVAHSATAHPRGLRERAGSSAASGGSPELRDRRESPGSSARSL
jgi:hypothetical protein